MPPHDRPHVNSEWPDTEADPAAVRANLVALLDRTLEALAEDRVIDDELVHETRKAIKRARAMVALLRPVLARPLRRRCQAELRAAARALATARDAAVLQDTLADVVKRAARAGRPSTASPSSVEVVLAPRPRDTGARRPGRGVASARRRLAAARDRVAACRLQAGGSQALAIGLRRIYRQARRAMPKSRASATTEALHEWRKRVKRYRYALENSGPSPTGTLRTDVRRADRLGELLGEDHDLALLADRLRGSHGAGTARRALLEAIARRRRKLQAEALELGARLLAARPAEVEARIRRAWQRGSVQPRRAATPEKR